MAAQTTWIASPSLLARLTSLGSNSLGSSAAGQQPDWFPLSSFLREGNSTPPNRRRRRRRNSARTHTRTNEGTDEPTLLLLSRFLLFSSSLRCRLLNLSFTHSLLASSFLLARKNTNKGQQQKPHHQHHQRETKTKAAQTPMSGTQKTNGTGRVEGRTDE
jgi:hypothetical protein